MRINNVTVNGKPLAEHLEAEATAEIAEVRQAEVRGRTWKTPAPRSKFGNTSRARTAPGQVIYTRAGRETHVIIGGTMFPWAEKAPYVRSGKSVLGAIEYDEKTDRVKCHECGEWHYHVGAHLAKAPVDHADARAYRSAHGIRRDTALCTPSCRIAIRNRPRYGFSVSDSRSGQASLEIKRAAARTAQLAQPRATAEFHNLHAQCQAQLSVRISKLAADIGKSPGERELRAAGIELSTVRTVFGMGRLNDVLASLNLPLRPGVPHRMGRRELIALIKQKAREFNRRPRLRDFGAKAAIYREFGSLAAAISAARVAG